MEYRDIPTRIHAHRPAPRHQPGCPQDGKYQHGSPAWAPEFQRYIKHVLPSTVAEDRRVWREWWTNPYVVSRLRKHLGEIPTEVALRVLRDRQSYDSLATEYNHTVGWVIRQKCRAMRLVRDRYLPHTSHHRFIDSGPHPDQASSRLES